MMCDYQIIRTINMIAVILLVFLYQAVSQNINIENINLIITDQDSIMNKIFSTVGIQYFAPYPSNYKTLPSTNTNTDTDRMKIINIASAYQTNHLEAYEFLTNYPKQTMRKKFVDFVNQYTAQSTKISVMNAFFPALDPNDKLSVMTSLACYLNKCRIVDSTLYENGYMSCKIYNDYYYTYYDIIDGGAGSSFDEHDYVLRYRNPNNYNALYILYINETLYT